MTRVVISQPMFFPWPGQLEQALLADVFVFLSDVQFARGFMNRVQVLVDGRQQFITVPTRGSKRSLLCDLQLDRDSPWREGHLGKLQASLAGAPHGELALEMYRQVTSVEHDSLASLSSLSVRRLCGEILGERRCPEFLDSRDFPRDVSATASLVHICRELGATSYLTGHGAKHYLDIQRFEELGIQVEFMDYCVRPYPQPGGAFTPYVTALDALGRLGPEGALGIMGSTAVAAERFLAADADSD